MAEEETIVATQSAFSDQTVQILDYPETRTGFTFNGWNTQQDGSGAQYDPGDTAMFDANTTLYAQWV